MGRSDRWAGDDVFLRGMDSASWACSIDWHKLTDRMVEIIYYVAMSWPLIEFVMPF